MHLPSSYKMYAAVQFKLSRIFQQNTSMNTESEIMLLSACCGLLMILHFGYCKLTVMYNENLEDVVFLCCLIP